LIGINDGKDINPISPITPDTTDQRATTPQSLILGEEARVLIIDLYFLVKRSKIFDHLLVILLPLHLLSSSLD
jgi:hypothetical protein